MGWRKIARDIGEWVTVGVGCGGWMHDEWEPRNENGWWRLVTRWDERRGEKKWNDSRLLDGFSSIFLWLDSFFFIYAILSLRLIRRFPSLLDFPLSPMKQRFWVLSGNLYSHMLIASGSHIRRRDTRAWAFNRIKVIMMRMIVGCCDNDVTARTTERNEIPVSANKWNRIILNTQLISLVEIAFSRIKFAIIRPHTLFPATHIPFPLLVHWINFRKFSYTHICCGWCVSICTVEAYVWGGSWRALNLFYIDNADFGLIEWWRRAHTNERSRLRSRASLK